MTLRENCTERQLRAHAVLDMVRAGIPISDHEIVLALIALGESLH